MVLFAGYENKRPDFDFRHQDDESDLDARLGLLTLDCLISEPPVNLSRLNVRPSWKLISRERGSDQSLPHVRCNEGRVYLRDREEGYEDLPEHAFLVSRLISNHRGPFHSVAF